MGRGRLGFETYLIGKVSTLVLSFLSKGVYEKNHSFKRYICKEKDCTYFYKAPKISLIYGNMQWMLNILAWWGKINNNLQDLFFLHFYISCISYVDCYNMSNLDYSVSMFYLKQTCKVCIFTLDMVYEYVRLVGLH